MANKFQIKRTSTSGVTPNTTNSANSAYIAPGELAVNMADSKLYTANTSSGLIELGSNLTNLSVTGTATVNAISANGSVGTSGQVLTSNGSGAYWSTVASSGGTVTSVGSGNGLTGGPVTTTGTLSVLANTGIIANATGLYVNSSYIATISANNSTYLNGQLASYYTNASNISTGTLAFARLPSLYLGTTAIQSTSAAQAVSGITTLAAGNTTITGFANVTTTLAAGNTTITGFANVSSTLQVTGAGTFSNTIGVTGAATFSNTVNVAANISGTSANVTITAGSFTTTFANNGVVTFPANVVFGNTTITANGGVGTSGQFLTSGASGNVYWSSIDLSGYQTTAGLSANVATLTANNATYAFGKSEADINANSALTANNASYVYGKQETQLNVNSATSASSANNASYLGGVAAADYQLESGLAANVATLQSNTALTANNATYAFGKSEGDLNANSALTANNADYLDGQHGSYYTNATNITAGTLPEAQLPYRMNQDVRSSDTVTFGNMTVTGNLTVSGTTVTVNANNLNIEDNMIYLNSGGANANPDLGWAGNYNDGTYRHAGMFRDASDSGIFKVFDQYVPEPDASPWLDTANATFRVADFQANTLYAAKISANGSVGSNGNVLVSNGAGMYWGSVSGGIQYTVKTANYTASDKDGIIADTSGGAFTITLPSSPAAGAQVVIVDGSDFNTNNLTVGRNGSTIESAAEDLILDITGVSVTFIYSGTTWQVYTQVGASAASPTYKIVSTTYTAAARDNLVANTSGGSFTITLPASPSLGDEVTIADGASFQTNPLTVDRNGSTIEGAAENMVLDVSGIRTNFVYSGGTWQIFTQVGLGGLAYVDVANNASYLGGIAANGYQTTTGLAANVATLAANSASFLGSTAANGYQTTSGLAANVATLTANNANNLSGYTWGSPAAIGGTAANTASFTNTTIVGTTTLQQTIEKAAIVTSAATGTVNFDVLDQAVVHYTTNASANWTINLRANSSTTLDSVLAANQSLTIAFLANQGSTAYYANVFQVDGGARTVKWQGGTTPTGGNANSVDMYVYTIMKTAANTYSVYGAQTRFA